jgi:hypothetical protein
VSQQKGRRLSIRQRDALDAWAAYLYRKGYNTRQVGSAMDLSSSTISIALSRKGVQARHAGPADLTDLEPRSFMQWEKAEHPPGSLGGNTGLNQSGLLTSALVTWQSRNALSLFAHRVQNASPDELHEGVQVLDRTIAYARYLQLVLSDPEFAAKVRSDPSYRDDIGHRFTP